MTPSRRPSRRHRAPVRRRPARLADITGQVRVLARLLSVVLAGLVVWIVVLGVSLPAADSTRQWRLLWIGFDTVELTALAVTLWAMNRARPLAIPAALITGTLFACDAWFDVVLSWATRGWWFSLASAVLVELPLAAVLWGGARSMARTVIARQLPRTVQATGKASGRPLELVRREPTNEYRRAAAAAEPTHAREPAKMLPVV